MEGKTFENNLFNAIQTVHDLCLDFCVGTGTINK